MLACFLFRAWEGARVSPLKRNVARNLRTKHLRGFIVYLLRDLEIKSNDLSDVQRSATPGKAFLSCKRCDTNIQRT